MVHAMRSSGRLPSFGARNEHRRGQPAGTCGIADSDPDFSGLPHPLRFPLPEEKKLIPSPLPSGLLGPVEVVPYRRVAVI